MRVVNRSEFMMLPIGTIFSEWDGSECIGMKVKNKTLFGYDGKAIDYIEANIINSIENNGTESFFEKVDLVNDGESVSLDMSYYGRNGLFDDEQKYAIYEEGDLLQMISLLQSSVTKEDS